MRTLNDVVAWLLKPVKWLLGIIQKPRCPAIVQTPNANWVSIVNFPWFGAYGHGEGRHAIHGWPSEIDFAQIEADLAKCRDHGVQVIRSFVFEDLDGLVKRGDTWHIAEEAVANLEKIESLFTSYNLKLEAVLFEFRSDLVQLYVADFVAAQPFKPAVEKFIELMGGIVWAIDLHNEVDALCLRRWESPKKLETAIARFRDIVKTLAPDLLYTCSTGWLGGGWPRHNKIGVEHLDFIEVHHYTHKQGEPWASLNPLSLCELETHTKPVLLGEYKSADFDKYAQECYTRGFLGAAPWSIHQDFPISDQVWQKIEEFNSRVIS